MTQLDPSQDGESFRRLLDDLDIGMHVSEMWMGGKLVSADVAAGDEFRSNLFSIFADEMCTDGITPETATLDLNAALHISELLMQHITSYDAIIRKNELIAVSGGGLVAVTERVGAQPHTEVLPLTGDMHLFGKVMLAAYAEYPDAESVFDMMPGENDEFGGIIRNGLVLVLNETAICDTAKPGEVVDTFERATVPLPVKDLRIHKVLSVV